jgi:hypothetical protein
VLHKAGIAPDSHLTELLTPPALHLSDPRSPHPFPRSLLQFPRIQVARLPREFTVPLPNVPCGGSQLLPHKLHPPHSTLCGIRQAPPPCVKGPSMTHFFLEDHPFFLPPLLSLSRRRTVPTPAASRSPDSRRVTSPDSRCVPSPDSRCVPTPDSRCVPSPDSRCVPSPDSRCVPSPGARSVPSPAASRVPTPAVSRLPTPAVSRVPAPAVSRVPARGTVPGVPSPGDVSNQKPAVPIISRTGFTPFFRSFF